MARPTRPARHRRARVHVVRPAPPRSHRCARPPRPHPTRGVPLMTFAITPLDEEAMAAALARHGRLAKPAGSLGRLEALGVQLAGISQACPPPLPEPLVVAVFAGDH